MYTNERIVELTEKIGHYLIDKNLSIEKKENTFKRLKNILLSLFCLKSNPYSNFKSKKVVSSLEKELFSDVFKNKILENEISGKKVIAFLNKFDAVTKKKHHKSIKALIEHVNNYKSTKKQRKEIAKTRVAAQIMTSTVSSLTNTEISTTPAYLDSIASSIANDASTKQELLFFKKFYKEWLVLSEQERQKKAKELLHQNGKITLPSANDTLYIISLKTEEISSENENQSSLNGKEKQENPKNYEIQVISSTDMQSFDQTQLEMEFLISRLSSQNLQKNTISLETIFNWTNQSLRNVPFTLDDSNKENLVRSIFNEFDTLKQDPLFTTWLRESLEVIAQNPTPQISALIDQLLNKLEGYEQSLHLISNDLNKTASNQPNILASTAHTPFAIPKSAQFSVTSGETINSELRKLKPSTSYPLLNETASPQVFLEKMQQWENYFETLKQKKQFEILDVELTYAMTSLPQAPLLNSLLNTMTEEQKIELSTRLAYLVRESTSNHFRLRLYAAPAANIVNNLKICEIQHTILRSIPRAKYGENSYSFLFNFRDYNFSPYLDFGEFGQEFLEIQQRLMKPPSNLSLLSVENNSFDNSSAGKYLARVNNEEFSGNKHTAKAANDRNFGTKISTVGDLRESILYSLILTNFMQHLETSNFRINHHDSDYIAASAKNPKKDPLPKAQRRIAEKLSANNETLSFKYSAGEVILDPLNLFFHHNTKTFFQNVYYHTNYYGKNYDANIDPENPVNSHDIRIKIVDTCMRTGYANGAGAEIEGHGGGACYLGACLSPAYVVNDETALPHLDAESSRELQASQTAPADRARNALINLSKYTHLLEQKETYQDWSNVFNLSLFAFGNLSTLLTKQPEMASEAVYLLSEFTKKYHAAPQALAPFYMMIIGKCVGSLTKAADRLPKNKVLKAAAEELKNIHTKELRALHEKLTATDGQFDANAVKAYLFGYMFCGDLHTLPDKDLIDLLALSFATLAKTNSLFTSREAASLKQLHLSSLQEAEKRGILNDNIASIVAYRIKNTKDWLPTKDAQFIFSTNDFRVDLLQGIIESQTASQQSDLMTLPIHIQRQLQDMVPQQELKKSHHITTASINKNHYLNLTLSDINGAKISVFVPLNNNNSLIIQRQFNSPPVSYQLQPKPPPEFFKDLPKNLEQLSMWTNETGTHSLFVDKNNEIKYQAETTVDAEKRLDILRLEQIFLKEAPRNVIIAPHLPINALSDPKDIIALGNETVPEYLYDDSHHLSYRWDKESRQWHSEQYPGYSLADKISDKLRLLFKSDFNHFQLLIAPEKPSIILLSPIEYKANKNTSHFISSHEKTLQAVPNSFSEEVIAFKVDPERGLIANSASEYLYLAYLFQTQGRFGLALKALNDAYGRLQPSDATAQQYISWMKNFEAKTSDEKAFKLKVLLLETEIKQSESLSNDSLIKVEESYEVLLKAYDDYLRIEHTISPPLKLNNFQKEKIIFLKSRSLHYLKKLSKKVQNHEALPFLNALSLEQRTKLDLLLLKSPYDENTLIRALKDEFHISNNTSKSIVALAAILKKESMLFSSLYLLSILNSSDDSEKAKKILNSAFDAEIALQKLRIAKKQQQANKAPTIASEGKVEQIVLEGNIDSYFKENPNSSLFGNLTAEYVNKSLNDLENFHPKGSVKHSMNKLITKDARNYCASLGFNLNDTAAGTSSSSKILDPSQDFNLLKNERKQLHDIHEEKSQKYKEDILNLLNLKTIKEDSLTERIKGKHHDKHAEIFIKIKQAYAVEDWSSLLDQKIIEPEDIPKIEALMTDYLLNKTAVLLAIKQVKQIDKWKNSNYSEEEGQRLQNLLFVKRQYDPKSYPYAKMALVIEESLSSRDGPGIIITPKQLQHFEDMLINNSAFKHEVWGGGKTTLLRNMIAEYHARRGYLAGLFTHAPLFGQHHKLLKETTSDVFGERAIALNFDLQMPRDPTALRQELLKLLRVTEEHGRVDQTLHSLIILEVV